MKKSFIYILFVLSFLSISKYSYANINNKIVCIKNADPGYDFIFTKKINGLITEFGGPNSHMSIRCNELQVPAAIGVGGHIYEKISKSNFIELDCNIKKISY